ncbi:hypothetical protein JCM10213v2_008879 [Rhodosporidiobolus nylandii]
MELHLSCLPPQTSASAMPSFDASTSSGGDEMGPSAAHADDARPGRPELKRGGGKPSTVRRRELRERRRAKEAGEDGQNDQLAEITSAQLHLSDRYDKLQTKRERLAAKNCELAYRLDQAIARSQLSSRARKRLREQTQGGANDDGFRCEAAEELVREKQRRAELQREHEAFQRDVQEQLEANEAEIQELRGEKEVVELDYAQAMDKLERCEDRHLAWRAEVAKSIEGMVVEFESVCAERDELKGRVELLEAWEDVDGDGGL